MPPHTFECFSFLLPHTFHWKNIYTKAKAIKPLQICESEKNQKDRKKETEASWKLIPTHGWKSAAQIFGRWLRVFHMPKRFILFSFRFVSTGFFFCMRHFYIGNLRATEMESAPWLVYEKHMIFVYNTFLGHWQRRRARGGEGKRRAELLLLLLHTIVSNSVLAPSFYPFSLLTLEPLQLQSPKVLRLANFCL